MPVSDSSMCFLAFSPVLTTFLFKATDYFSHMNKTFENILGKGENAGEFLMLSLGQTDEQTDRQTPVRQYAPNLSMQGHKQINGIFLCFFIDFKTLLL